MSSTSSSDNPNERLTESRWECCATYLDRNDIFGSTPVTVRYLDHKQEAVRDGDGDKWSVLKLREHEHDSDDGEGDLFKKKCCKIYVSKYMCISGRT